MQIPCCIRIVHIISFLCGCHTFWLDEAGNCSCLVMRFGKMDVHLRAKENPWGKDAFENATRFLLAFYLLFATRSHSSHSFSNAWTVCSDVVLAGFVVGCISFQVDPKWFKIIPRSLSFRSNLPTSRNHFCFQCCWNWDTVAQQRAYRIPFFQFGSAHACDACVCGCFFWCVCVFASWGDVCVETHLDDWRNSSHPWARWGQVNSVFIVFLGQR